MRKAAVDLRLSAVRKLERFRVPVPAMLLD
jgi:hypothetical protein